MGGKNLCFCSFFQKIICALKRTGPGIITVCVSSLGLCVGVLGELAADQVEGEDGLHGKGLPRPQEGRQEPHDQLKGDLERGGVKLYLKYLIFH